MIVGVIDYNNSPLRVILVVPNLHLPWALVVVDVSMWPLSSLLSQFMSVSSLLCMTMASYHFDLTLLILIMGNNCSEALLT